MSLPKGIDISHYQARTPSLTGLSFAWIKASEGTTPDLMYPTHVANVRKAGLWTGAYCFARDDVPLAAQARYFLAHAQDARALAVDVEGPHATNSAETRVLIANIKFYDPLKRPVLLYMSAGWFFANVGQDGNWIAQWPGTGQPTPGTEPTRRWAFWQYRGSPLDLDVFNGTLADLQRLGPGLTLPDTGTIGEDMPGVSFTPVTPERGTFTYAIADGNLIDVADGSFTPVPKGFVRNSFGSVTIEDGKYAGLPAYLVTAKNRACLSLSSHGTYVADPKPTTSCEAPIANAVAPLNAQIGALKGQLVTATASAKSAERERIALAEANRIRGI